MIPKIIHYCWFGRGEKPEMVKRCIKSWHKFCPDYQIFEWNEDNCDIALTQFTREAYSAKKYAFVADVMRLVALQKHGGVYFDTDVEVIKDITPLLKDDGFIGFENGKYVNSGQVFASVANHPVVNAMIEDYNNLHFLNQDGSLNAIACPHINTKVMEQFGLVCNGQEQIVAGIHVYPEDYFNPMNSLTGKLTKTSNTYSIHWYAQSWLPKKLQIKSRIGRIFRRFLGPKCFDLMRWLKTRGGFRV